MQGTFRSVVAGATIRRGRVSSHAADDTGIDQSWLVWKRVIDVAVGLPLAVLVVPVVLLSAAGLALTLRQWPLFVQLRVGRNGRLFSCPKLRTLKRDTPAYASKYAIPQPTGFAAWLRRTHLDELPQLFVVPLGWLSLVGPRPEMPGVFDRVPEEYLKSRLQVPQGCSGLWQIGPHTTALLHESPEYDLFYVRNGSVRLDLWILWRTILLLFKLGDCIGLERVPTWALRDRPRALADLNGAADPVTAD